jgi:F-type H+-transporting ATPase subunit c
MKLKALTLAAMMMAATPMFAQGTTAQGTSNGLLVPAFAMALASGVCALGQARAISSAAEGVARNPGAAGKIQTLLLLGLAFIESLALFTFVKVG